MDMYKFSFNYKQLLSLVISFSLVFTSIPTKGWSKSSLAPSGEATGHLIKQNLSSIRVPRKQKNDSNITRRDLFKNTRNLAASVAVTYLLKSKLLMAKDAKKTLPRKISLKDMVSQKDLEVYRYPHTLLLEPETFYDQLAWQKRLISSGKPLEFGPGYIYHGWENLDDAIIKGKVISEKTVIDVDIQTKGKDHILRSYLTRAPHYHAMSDLHDPNANSPAVYMIHTKEFNRLVDEGKACFDYDIKGADNKKENIIDPFPNIFDSFSLDIVSEIWVRNNDYERYMDLVNLPDKKLKQLSEREKKLRQNLIPLMEKNIIKPIPLLLLEKLQKEADDQERANYVTQCTGQWMAQRRLFDKIPLFKAKNEALPKDEPLTPYDAILKFMSDLPKGLSREEIYESISNNENAVAMRSYFFLLPCLFALFKDDIRIFNAWAYILQTPLEMEARAREILEDEELVRLFMFNKSYRKDDYSLEEIMFISDDYRKAIKTLIRKDYGVNILVENIVRLPIILELNDEEAKAAIISFISAVKPEKLLQSPLCFEPDNETEKLTAEQRIKYLNSVLVITTFWGEFVKVYNILIDKGYTSKNAGKLLADWSYYPANTCRAIGIKDLIKIYGAEVKDSEKDIIAERVADELIQRRQVFIKYKMVKYIKYVLVSILACMIFVRLLVKIKSRHLNNLKINKFKEAIKKENLSYIAGLLTDRQIIKLVNLAKPNQSDVMKIVKGIKLEGNEKRAIVRIIKQIQPEQEKDKNEYTIAQTAPNSQIRNRGNDILKSK